MVRRDQRDAELAAELESHLQIHIDDNVRAGMTSAEARRQALIKLGGIDQTKEAVRERRALPWLESVAQDIRFALRMMRKSPGFTAVAVITLALGIGATTAIVSVLYALMLKPLPVSDPNRLLGVTNRNQNAHSYAEWIQFRDTQDIFSSVLAYNGWNNIEPFRLTESGETHEVGALYASGDYFKPLGVPAFIGRTLDISDDRAGALPVCVIAYDFWRQHYQQSKEALGKSLILDGHEFQIVGVAPPHFFGLDPGFKPDIFMPLEAERKFHDYPRLRSGVPTPTLDNPNSGLLVFIGRLKPNVTIEQAEARLRILGQQVYGALPPVPYKRGTYSASTISGPRSDSNSSMLFLVMTMAAVALLIACANLGNLLLARASKRQSEIATRLAVGATRRRMVQQLMTEGLVLASIGACVGTLIQYWGSLALVAAFSNNFAPTVLDLSWDAKLAGFVFAVTLLCTLLFGLAPAIGSARVPLYAAMKNISSAGKGRHRLSNGLLISLQVALSMALLVSAGLLVRTVRSLLAKNPGYQPQGVMVAKVSSEGVGDTPEHTAFEGRELLEQFRAIPGVVSASWSANGSYNGPSITIVHDPNGAERRPRVYGFRVSSDFFKTRRTAIIAGRDFVSTDSEASPPVAIVSAQAAKTFFPGRNPIGLRFSQSDDGDEGHAYSIAVVGVAGDIDYQAPNYGPLSIVYRPTTQCADCSEMGRYEMRFAGPIADVGKRLGDATALVDPRLAVEFHPLSDEVSASVDRNRSMAWIATLFGLFAGLLAVIGVYGVTSYATAERTREIGIRIALGARRFDIFRMIVGEIIVLVFIGIGFGVWAAFAAAQSLRGMIWGVSSTDPLSFVAAAALMVVVAGLAAFFPAWRAARIDPVSAMRCE